MLGTANCNEPIGYDNSIQAVGKIFDVMLWRKQIPPCFLTWVRNNFRNKIWQLRVMPYPQILCNSTVQGNGILDVRYYECGCHVNDRGNPVWGFKNRQMKKGAHDSLHNIIHCLNSIGIREDDIEIEERYNGYIVDAIAKLKNNKVIVVELGEIDKIGKFDFVDEESVEAFWFGDKKNFIYSLSRKRPINKTLIGEEGANYSNSIANYYKTYCSENRLGYHCMSYNSVYNCNQLLRHREFMANLHRT